MLKCLNVLPNGIAQCEQRDQKQVCKQVFKPAAQKGMSSFGGGMSEALSEKIIRGKPGRLQSRTMNTKLHKCIARKWSNDWRL